MTLTDAQKELAKTAWDEAVDECLSDEVTEEEGAERVAYAVFMAGMREGALRSAEIPMLLRKNDA